MEEQLPNQIGPYPIVKSLGKGGMGEVYLARDANCERNLALKRIRPELKDNKTIRSRFLREAKVASGLSHPAIIPIFSIQTTGSDIYYTMPYVEGETLRQILRTARETGKEPIGQSIFALARIFLQICEALAYTHSKGVLHRDVKPENILVGKYGEVMIIDWGIADFIGQDDPLPEKNWQSTDLTRPGKITGTLAYMAPERLTGHASSAQTDLYALGVILYQMLTLQLPFQRKSLAAFRRQVHNEELIDPIELAPYREIPHQLSAVCCKCLAPSAKDRYKGVEELLVEIKNFIEGKSEWVLAKDLDVRKKGDWQFQENILIAKHMALTQSLDVSEWAELMVSKGAFADNVCLSAEIRLNKESQGLGFLLSIPEGTKRLEEGYCLWIDQNGVHLFRSQVEILNTTPLALNTWHKIRFEKVDDQLSFFVDGALQFKYIGHLPLAGHHVGFLHKDGTFQLKNFKVYDSSRNAMIGCLAVPNAFLSHKMYDAALQEYRRIGSSFPGRLEGREALFRAGLTLLEKAKAEKNDRLYHTALKEFERLYKTSGAPLEYLGKSMVYQAICDFEEEAKCLELALRKFPRHPLLPMLKEHIIHRMHESSLKNRESAYRIILLALRHIPDLLDNPDAKRLIDTLEKNWEKLPFIKPSSDRLHSIAILLAFWLANVPILTEIAQSIKSDETLLNNALMCLQELEAKEALAKFLPKTPPRKKSLTVWKLLEQRKLTEAKALFDQFPKEVHDDTSVLHFPYGTYLYMTISPAAAKKHFAQVLETPYPPTTALPSLFLTNRLGDWMERAFLWEKKELHRLIELFYRCVK